MLEGAVEGLDPARDRQRLLGLYPTAFCPPQRFGFQAHMGDAVSVNAFSIFLVLLVCDPLRLSFHLNCFCAFLTRLCVWTFINVRLSLIIILFSSSCCQVTQIISQQQVQAELTLRLTQLQTRLASLKIENEEVRREKT